MRDGNLPCLTPPNLALPWAKGRGSRLRDGNLAQARTPSGTILGGLKAGVPVCGMETIRQLQSIYESEIGLKAGVPVCGMETAAS